MTSLAAQLRKLAVPETQVVLSGDLKKASFLYDDGEAAKIDKQHFYNIGVNGLQKLMEKDERFVEYEQNLFSPSSQTLQRYVQTSEVNQKLDETINRFLLQLSPYMQLREAHKAMEWMVYRYNVHLRNVDVLMMCVLPYHDQQPFIMALRLLKMNSNECAKWKWLEPVKKAGSFLSRQTLIQHCKSVKGFLGFMCNLLSKHIEANTDESGNPSARHLQRVIMFYTQVVIGTLQLGPTTEMTLTTLMPVITIGIKSHQLPELIMTSYMILSQLLTQTDFTTALLEPLVNVIAKNAQPKLVSNAVTVLTLMYQKQSISKIPKKAFKYLCKFPNLKDIFSSLANDIKIEPLLSPFMHSLTKRALKEVVSNTSATSDSNPDDSDVTHQSFMSLLVQMLTLIPMEKETISDITQIILNWFVEQNSSDPSMEVDSYHQYQHDGPFRIFRLLENRFSNIVESVIQEFNDTNASPEVKVVINNLLEQSVASAQHDLNTDPMSHLILCLCHRHSIVRKQAVERLLNDVNLLEDKESVQSAIVMRLQDEDPSVVVAVLNKPENLWDLFEDKVSLYQILLKKLGSISDDKKQKEVRDSLVETLCHVPEEIADPMELTSVMLSYFVLTDFEDIPLVEAILSSSLSKWHKLLNYFKTCWQPHLTQQVKDFKFLVSLYVKLTDALTTFIMLNVSESENFVKSLFKSLLISPRPASTGMILLSICEKLILAVEDPLVKSGLQYLMASFISNFIITKKIMKLKEEITGNSNSLPACLTFLGSQKCISMTFCQPLLTKLDLSCVPSTLKDLKFWELSLDIVTCESNTLKTLTVILNLVCELSTKPEVALKKQAEICLFDVCKFLKDSKDMIKFLCMIWMAKNNQGVSSILKAHTLQFSRAFMDSFSNNDRQVVLAQPTPILPCLIMLLFNKHEKVREIAISMLESLVEPSSASTQYKLFIDGLLNCKQEITKDNEFLCQVLKNLLEYENLAESTYSPAKKRRRTSSNVPLHLEIVNYLFNLISDKNTPCIIKTGLLSALKKLDTVESFQPLMHVLKEVIAKTDSSVEISGEEKDLISLILRRLSKNIAGCVVENSECLNTLLLAVRCSYQINGSSQTVQILLLKQLNSEILAAMPLSSQQAFINEILNLISTTNNPDLGRLCRRVVKHMTLASTIVIDELKKVLSTAAPVTIREAKKQKLQASDAVESSELETLSWRRVTILFEMIQIKKKISNALLLVPVAFQVLSRVLELEQKGSGEYLKQLILGTINFICSRHQETTDEGNIIDSVKGEHLNMELIVNCIRSSDNQHTHQQALLLLCTAAKIAPGLLLYNMMTVFTFMGANILRQDDAFSFHVIGRILENVIPALVLACQEKSKEKKIKVKSASVKIRSEEMMTVVLRVFVDALPHIPSHRKIMLFEKLMMIMGTDRYLWRLILLFIESITVRTSKSTEDQVMESENEKSSGPLTVSDMEFLESIVEKFPCSQLFPSYQLVLSYVLSLPEEKEGSQVLQLNKESLSLEDMTSEDMEIFSIAHHSAKQLRHFKFATVFALNELIVSKHLVAQMSISEPSIFLSSYQSMMETVLTFISQVTDSSNRLRDTSSARFWRILLNKSHDLLDNLVNLLPDSMFMEVVSGLMDHSLPLVQRRAMELLNTKLQHYKEHLTSSQVKMLVAMTTKVISITKQCLLKKGNAKEEALINGQTALYTLKVLCRILGDKYNHLPEILQLCNKVLTAHSDNGIVAASSLLCVAEVVGCLKLHSFGFLSDFMPLVLSHLKSSTITQYEVLLLAAIISLQKIVEVLSAFLSPYLFDIIIQICLISSAVESHSETHKPVVLQKIKLICTTISTMTPTRTFLPVLRECFKALKDKFVSCADCAMSMLKDHIIKMSKEDLTTFSSDLLEFFFACLDIRATHLELDDDDVLIIEGYIIEAFVSMVFKLSEAQFKPMLLNLYNWATDENVSKERLLVFYRLCDSLAGKLKNLFTLFAGHIMKHCSEMLDINNKSKQRCILFGKNKAARAKSSILLVYIIDCLQKTFAHDTEGFLNKERFEMVMQPLVDQLENTVGNSSVCEDRILNHLVPCIASLAAAAHDDSLWKDLNYQILLKTRHENYKVRIWALAAIDAFHKQLGEDYTQLVPETIPFMAELMEDESDEVEKFTQKVLAAMEISVGENLQEYF